MSFFSFYFNRNLFNVLVYWSVEIILTITMEYLPDCYKVSNDLKDNEFMFIIFPSISKSLSGFLIIYIFCVFHNNSKYKSQKKRQLIYSNPISVKKDKSYFLKLFLIISLEILARSSNFIYSLITSTNQEDISKESTKEVFIFMDILTRYIFSIFILKVKTFKHHILSIILITFGFILIVPFDIINAYYKRNIDFIHSLIFIIISTIKSIVYPFEDTNIKLFFNKYYILPERMLFSISLFEISILLIISIIFYYTDIINFDLIYNPKVIITMIFYCIASGIKEYIIIRIIYLYSSQTVAFLIISEMFSSSLVNFINFFRVNDNSNIPLQDYISLPFIIIALLIILFATLLYDEIIIINKWGLNVNVKKGITKRAQIEVEFTTFLNSEEHTVNNDEATDRSVSLTIN